MPIKKRGWEKLEEWTEGYYGVFHCNKVKSSGVRVTIAMLNEDRGEVKLFDTTIEFQAFTAQKSFYGTLKECEAKGNNWAKTYQAQYI